MNTIRITSSHFKKLNEYLLSKKEESAAFLLAGFFKTTNGIHFVVREVLIPENDEYDSRTEYHLEISAKFFNRVLSRAERSNTTIIQCHSHPFSDTDLRYSASDNFGESTSSKTVYDCLNKKPMGSLLFGNNAMIGRVWLTSKKPISIDQLWLVDRHMKIQDINVKPSMKKKINFKMFDRQIRAFGVKGQEILSQLKVGIVGTGGTGSSVAEQLAREGVTDFTLIDQDKFEISNLTRLYGSYANTKRKYKSKIVKSNILKIQPTANVIDLAGNVISQGTLKQLKECNVIFCCTDNHASRSVINEVAYQYFIPVIDVGVGIDTKENNITGGSVRATLISPTLPCMYCLGIVNSERILAESLNKEDRMKREKEGYIRGMEEDDAPSVITFTTMAATFGLSMLKDLFFNLIDSNAPTIILDIKSFETTRLNGTIQSDCVCISRFAKGDYTPLSAP